MKIDQLPQVLSEAQQNLLIATTPKQYIKQRKARGNQTVDYVEIGYVLRLRLFEPKKGVLVSN